MILLPSANAMKPAESGDDISQSTVLEITCTGLGHGDRAVYYVYGPEGGKVYSVALQGTGAGQTVSTRITGLRPGRYKVVPAGWDWTYKESPDSVEMIIEYGRTAVFNFTSSKRSGIPLHYEEGKLNRFYSHTL